MWLLLACAIPEGRFLALPKSTDSDTGLDSGCGAPESCDAVDNDCDGRIDEDACDGTTATYGEHTYVFVTTDATWADASATCAGWGYHLVDVDDAAENAYLWGVAEPLDSAAAWWIGLSDQTTEGSFVWETGSTWSFTNWKSGEPNNFNGVEDCAAFGDNGSGTWNDRDCANVQPYICEVGCTTSAFYLDQDGDGAGNTSNVVAACSAPEGYTADSTDCDDADPSIIVPTWYADTDGDGFGDNSNTASACDAPTSYTADPTDCDDTDATAFPGAPEVNGDGLDQDCDGADSCVLYADADGDGFGDPAVTIDDCDGAVGYVNNADDPVWIDCDDADPTVSPDAIEVWYDGLDQDCDGADDNDQDGDGAPIDTDCDDTDPTVSPLQAESCDADDDNCNGLLDDGGCDGTTATYGEHTYVFVTTDATWAEASATCAGWGYHLVDVDDAAENAYLWGVAEPLDSAAAWWIGLSDQTTEGSFVWETGSTWTFTLWNSGEPNDFNGAEDCAAFADNGGGAWNDRDCANVQPYICEVGCTTSPFYLDQDGDGAGDTSNVVAACSAPEGYTAIADDCDDADPTVAAPVLWYTDFDGDGFGDPSLATSACAAPDGTTAEGGDCNDADASVSPDALEIALDGIDQDCNGVDSCVFYVDADGDGFGDPAIAIDDCSGVSGYVAQGGDCDDADPAVSPAAAELWYDGLDQDCDGADDYDQDGDGVYPDAGDCDDTDATTWTGAAEACDAADNDCDGTIDEEGCPVEVQTYNDHRYLFLDTWTDWATAQATCAGWGYHLVDIDDAAENTFVWDAAFATNTTTGWWLGLNDRDEEGTYVWDGGATSDYRTWRAGEPNDFNSAEDCAGFAVSGGGEWNDRSCADVLPFVCEAGCITTTWAADADGDGFGDPTTATTGCTGPVGYVNDAADCDDADPSTWPGAPELEDGIDNNCDGEIEPFDSDGDGLLDTEEAAAGCDPNSADTDGDGLDDKVEADADTDGDGAPNCDDPDDDNDEVPTAQEGDADTDGDGLDNYQDTDSDNDTVRDGIDGLGDTDGDGTADILDTDDDGDGIPTYNENTVDPDGDGTPATDLDADETPNYLDLDSDNDGCSDGSEGDEDVDLDGIPDYVDPDDCTKAADPACGCTSPSPAPLYLFLPAFLFRRRRSPR